MTDAIVMTVESVRTRASTNEALVTLAVPLEQAGLVSSFMGKIGRQVGAAFADVAPGQIAPKMQRPENLYGKKAEALKLSGFFRRPEVWRAIGSPDAYHKWVSYQPSAWSGEFSEVDAEGNGRCVAAHFRRIETGAGTGIKDDYTEIPLTHNEHAKQHEKGWVVFDQPGLPGMDWAAKKRIDYVSRWAWETLRSHFGETSMAHVLPEAVREWAREADVERFLPEGY